MHVAAVEKLSESWNKGRMEMLLADFAESATEINDTMAAMQDYFTEIRGKLATQSTPFLPGINIAETIEGRHFVLGAPEFVLGAQLGVYAETIEKYSSRDFRTLAFAEYPMLPGGEKLSGKGTPIALIALENKIRDGAAKTFHFFAQQGFVSGDIR